MFLTPAAALSVALATDRELIDKRGPHGIRWNLDLGKEELPALAQCKGGLAGGVIYPRHIKGGDISMPRRVKKRKSSNPCKHSIYPKSPREIDGPLNGGRRLCR